MRRILILLSVATALVAALYASDPWKEKKYGDWSLKEAEKVLSDSPWSRVVIVRMTTGPAMEGRGGRSRGGGGGAGGISGGLPSSEDSSIGAGAGGGGGMGAGRGGMDDLAAPGGREMRIMVRWQTATPVRQALARQQVLSGKLTLERAEQFVKERPDKYIIYVTGLPRMAMAGATPDRVKSSTFLKPGSGEKVALEDIKMGGAGMPELYFIFPRAAQPPDAATVKNIEFGTTLGRFDIRKKFPLKDMVYEGKLEL